MKKLCYIILCVSNIFLAYGQKDKYQLSSHILDIAKGTPAKNVTIQLEKLNKETKKWTLIDEKITDENGRIKNFLNNNKPNRGVFKLRYLVAEYFKKQNTSSFYPFIEVVFEIKDSTHYHVPITLSPYGYSTYRGN